MVSNCFTWIDANRQKQILYNKVLVRNIEYKKMLIFLAFDVLKEMKKETVLQAIVCVVVVYIQLFVIKIIQ